MHDNKTQEKWLEKRMRLAWDYEFFYNIAKLLWEFKSNFASFVKNALYLDSATDLI